MQKKAQAKINLYKIAKTESNISFYTNQICYSPVDCAISFTFYLLSILKYKKVLINLNKISFLD